MKILAIGVGTAGSRIVDTIASKSGKTSNRGINAIAVDNNPKILEELENINSNAKFYFPEDDLKNPEKLTTSFTIEEVSSKLRAFDNQNHDAILICAGLGGALVDLVPYIVEILRKTLFEPVFGLVVLPEKAHGIECSKKAVQDLETIKPILDGTILFDNEIWYKKVQDNLSNMVSQQTNSIGEKFWIPGTHEAEEIDPYHLINIEISRSIRLLVKAGEIQDDAPEMVLDTNEILNTIKGMGNIIIGYAKEDLENETLMDRFVQKEDSLLERQERATRIVNLSKKALTRDISAYCDISTAKKALVLLVGPEEELSMKGFMAVRSWLDESIGGYELRSGDYPISVRQGKHVAVLILLSGVTGIPRLRELRDLSDAAQQTEETEA